MTAPIVEATRNACILSTLSNVLAQLITCYRNNDPYTLTLQPIFHFLIFTLLTSPPNFLYQQLLESIFPSSKKGTSELSKRNTLAKFLIDQTLGASLNTLAFIYIFTAFNGGTIQDASKRVEADFWPVMVAGYKLWPFVSLLGFVAVRSVKGRALLGSVAGLGWNIYLSLVAGR